MQSSVYQGYADILIGWQHRFRALPPEKGLSRIASWAPCQQLVRSAISLDKYARKQLQRALQESNKRFAPLEEPLLVNTGTHRWFASEREESYSDWLAWILQEICAARDIPRLFEVEETCTLTGADSILSVTREEVAGDGRTDVVVRFDSGRLLLVEIKTRPPGEDLKRQLYCYYRWVKDRSVAHDAAKLILLAVEEPREDIEPFHFCSWQTLCRQLRGLASFQISKGALMSAAILLAFSGAVEQNLLRISQNPPRFRAMASVDYLQNWRNWS